MNTQYLHCPWTTSFQKKKKDSGLCLIMIIRWWYAPPTLFGYLKNWWLGVVCKLWATIGKQLLDNKNCNCLWSICVDAAPLAHQNEIQNSTYVVPASWQVVKDYGIHTCINAIICEASVNCSCLCPEISYPTQSLHIWVNGKIKSNGIDAWIILNRNKKEQKQVAIKNNVIERWSRDGRIKKHTNKICRDNHIHYKSLRLLFEELANYPGSNVMIKTDYPPPPTWG